MNAIERLKAQIEAAYPEATCTLDPGERAGAAWFLDCRRGVRHVAVEWRARDGFGISASDEEEGVTMDGPDEIHLDPSDALARVIALLRVGRTGTVRALREARSVSQSELAERLGISQPALSKLERQDDLHLSTLRRFVEQLGGRLTVQAEFPGGTTARVDLTPPSVPPPHG